MDNCIHDYCAYGAIFMPTCVKHINCKREMANTRTYTQWHATVVDSFSPAISMSSLDKDVESLLLLRLSLHSVIANWPVTNI